MKNIDRRLKTQAETIREQKSEINTLRIDFERAHASIHALERMYALLLSYAEKKRQETANKEEYAQAFNLMMHMEAFGNLLERAVEDMDNSYAMSVEVIL